MNMAMLAAFWAVSMMFIITPGADRAYTILAGLRDRAIIPAAGGHLLGHLLATLVVAAGVAGLIAAVSFAFTGLTVIGAAYLLCTACRAGRLTAVSFIWWLVTPPKSVEQQFPSQAAVQLVID